MSELLPCPFCGGEARIVTVTAVGESWVRCDKCKANSEAHTDKRLAIAAWNNRFWGKEIMLMGDRLYFEGLGTFERVKDEH